MIFARSLPPLIVALVPGQQRYLDKLKAMREHLSNEVASLINDFGPRLYDDFNEARFNDSPACVVILRLTLFFSRRESLFPPPVCLRQVPIPVSGDARAVLVLWMLRVSV